MTFDFDPEKGAIIAIDKPYGWTSSDVVRKIKFILQKKTGLRHIKVGHAGTLDPLATGLLLLCAGKATKQVETLQAGEKEYVATIRFGATTPSFDLEKDIDHIYPFEHITQQAIMETLQQFVGLQEQMPPLFSAKSINGRRAYNIARAGEETTMRPSTVMVHELELQHFNLPDADIKISCGKGTYIRSLARDLGTALHSGAHLTALRRIKSGKYHVSEAFSITEFENIFKKM
jgi:tRNA pseudouridine55 synthase